MTGTPPLSTDGYVDVFPFVRTDEGLRLLIMRRAADESYPGIWQGVAGRINPGETAVAAARRELKEETGREARNLYTLDHVSTYYLHASNELLHVPAFIAELADMNLQISPEHDSFQWLSLDDAVKLASWKPYREALRSIPQLLRNEAALALAKIDTE